MPLLVAGQTNSPSAVYPANRYLLVVETSRSMQRRAGAMVQSVQDLLSAAVAGQARSGDSLGVWIFNEELYTGLLSLQQWSPETQKSVTDRVVGFLRAQRFEKRARFDKVLPALDRVVRNSPFITIVLVCAGEDEIHGTPFDQRINDFFQTWRLPQQEARTPFVIALRAQAGRYVDCAMNPAPWPAELPPLPKELFVARPSPRSPATEPRKSPAPTVPPLIITGRKPEAKPPATNKEPTEPTTAVPATTNLGPQSQPTLPGQVAGPQEAAQKTAAAPLVQSATVLEPGPSSPPSAVTAAPVPAPAASEAPQSSQRTLLPLPVTASTAGAVVSQPGADMPANLKPVPPANFTSTDPAPALSSAGPARLEVPPQPKSSGGQPATASTSFSNRAPVEIAAAASSRPPIRHWIIWSAGLILFGAVLALVWIWRRRSRPTAEVSLITQSIDRRQD